MHAKTTSMTAAMIDHFPKPVLRHSGVIALRLLSFEPPRYATIGAVRISTIP